MNKYNDLDPFIQKILSLKCMMLLRQTRKTLYELSKEYDLDREEFEGSFVMALVDTIVANPNETYDDPGDKPNTV